MMTQGGAWGKPAVNKVPEKQVLITHPTSISHSIRQPYNGSN
jgi:hypothetical protein